MTKVREFRPKAACLRRLIRTAGEAHPTIADIKAMAEDTIRDADQYINDPARRAEVIGDARMTIADAGRKKCER